MSKHLFCVSLGVLALAGTLGRAEARTWHILPDGSGDAPTIQAGIDSTVAGDQVLLAPGTYFENLSFNGKAIEVASESGAEVTTIDGSHGTSGPAARSTVRIGTPWPGSALRGITITGGAGSRGPDSDFRWGGGILSAGGDCHISDCIITGNTADAGGGIALLFDAGGTISGTRIENNWANERGGGIWLSQTPNDWSIVSCLVTRNGSPAGAGIHVDYQQDPAGGPDIESCSIVLNYGAGLQCNWHSRPKVLNTIISMSSGAAVVCDGSAGEGGYPTLTCCNIYGNSGGDYGLDCIADQAGVNGNLSADALFCDASVGDFTLRSDSPCLPGQHPDGYDCGLIGALGEGCTAPTAVERTSWGGVKRMFR